VYVQLAALADLLEKMLALDPCELPSSSHPIHNSTCAFIAAAVAFVCS
jgi:hypothetical protein